MGALHKLTDKHWEEISKIGWKSKSCKLGSATQQSLKRQLKNALDVEDYYSNAIVNNLPLKMEVAIKHEDQEEPIWISIN